MTAYELMIKTNRHLLQGGTLTDAQKADAVRQLLAACSSERTRQSFYRAVRFPGNIDKDGRRMYPACFIPPYNDGKKLQTVIPLSPKTHILSANAYELEIIRLLHLFAPEEPTVRNMVQGTLERLRTTCFGNGCAAGECFHAALPVLRFLAACAPGEAAWIGKLLAFFNAHMEEKLRNKYVHGNVFWYFWMCLSELPIAFAEPEIRRVEERMLGQLRRSSVMNSACDKVNRPVMICVVRNAMARLPEYAYLSERQPYISEKDGRLHFETKR